MLPGQGRRQDALTGAIWEWVVITIADWCRTRANRSTWIMQAMSTWTISGEHVLIFDHARSRSLTCPRSSRLACLPTPASRGPTGMLSGCFPPQFSNFPSSTPPQTLPSFSVPMTFPLSVSLPFGRHFQAAKISNKPSPASLLTLVFGWCAHKLFFKYISH